MSPKQKTGLQRQRKSKPNKANLKKRLQQIQENIKLLQSVAEENAWAAAGTDTT